MVPAWGGTYLLPRLIVIGANYNVEGLKETPRAEETILPRSLSDGFYAPGPPHWPRLYRRVVTMWRTQPNYSLEDLGRITAPTLVIAGEFDAIRREHTDQRGEEVVARLRVILRRTGRGHEEPKAARLTFADIELDEDTHEVWKAGEPVSLSPTEFTLLRYFIINAGTVLSKPKILDHVWRYDFGGDVNVVESYVSYLRRKIDTGEKRLLHTLRGVGYVLREPR